MSQRAIELAAALGDPWDGGNPVGHAAVLAADERGELLAAGEAALDRFGLGAEYVPVALGGRLDRLDDLIAIMRTVFRRDPCLGLGHGASSFIAAVNVWVGGRPEQRRQVADLLLACGKLACGYFELDHGNDLGRVALSARSDGDRLVLDGGKQAISNLARAEAMVLFARTSDAPGGRSHSQLLIERAALPAACVEDRPRFATVGMRGVQLGGIELRGCPVAASCVLGEPGRGLETALTSFQLTRIALPGMFLGVVDSGLRLAVRYSRGRSLYGRNVIDLPLTRAVLAEVFVDLLVSDCVTSAVARAVHVLPREVSMASAATKFVVPRLLTDAMTKLASLLGASFYLRRGEHAMFQKLVRDLPPVSFGHLSRVAALMTMLPQLPSLARRAWLASDAAPASVFARDGELPALAFDRLALISGGHDHLTASLVAIHDQLAGAERAPLHALTARFVAELTALKAACAALAPHAGTPAAPAATYELAARYALVLAASACVATWWHNRGAPFLGEPAWLVAALTRLAARLTGAAAPPLAESLTARLFDELMARFDAGHGFDLANQALPGWHDAPLRDRSAER